MTLPINQKTKFDQRGVTNSYYYEAHTNPSVDDVLSFFAQSEAERRRAFRFGDQRRDSQVPSDELKAYLMDFEE